MTDSSPGITDFHTHAFPDALAPRAMEVLLAESPHEAVAHLDGTVADLIRSMDRAGIRRSVLCSIATAPKQFRPILDWSLSVRSDRIVPFASFHPDADDPAARVLEIADAGLLGIKLHPMYQNFVIDEERLMPAYAAMQEAGLVLLFHAGQDMAFPADEDRADPDRLLRVHERFPDLRIVAAHLGGWHRWTGVAELLAGTGIYLDTSYSLDRASPDELRTILARHPVERIVYATDSPWRDQAGELELIRATWPDPEDQAKVTSLNAASLLGRA